MCNGQIKFLKKEKKNKDATNNLISYFVLSSSTLSIVSLKCCNWGPQNQIKQVQPLKKKLLLLYVIIPSCWFLHLCLCSLFSVVAAGSGCQLRLQATDWVTVAAAPVHLGCDWSWELSRGCVTDSTASQEPTLLHLTQHPYSWPWTASLARHSLQPALHTLQIKAGCYRRDRLSIWLLLCDNSDAVDRNTG